MENIQYVPHSGLRRQQLGWILFTAGFLGVVLILNLCYEFCSDDCCYGILQSPPAGHTGLRPRIATWGNLIHEMIHDWHRPVVHFFVRLFTGILGKTAFSVANTMMMGLFILLFHRLAIGQWLPRTRQIAWQIGLIFLILCKGESYLWCAGSCNYLWAGTATLAFYGLWLKLESQRPSPLMLGLAIPFAYYCGWIQEAFSLPMCFALGIYSLARLRKVTLVKVLIGCAYLAGTLVLSIVSARRLTTVVPFSWSNLLMTEIKIAVAAKGVWALLILFLCQRKKLHFLTQNAFPLLIVTGSLLMISVIGFNGERSLWAANLFALLIVAKNWQMPRWMTWPVVSSQLLLWGLLIPLGLKIHANFIRFRELFLASPTGVTYHERVNCGPLARFFHQSIYQWQPGLHGTGFAMYWGRETLPFALSKELYQSLYLDGTYCTEANRLPIAGNFYTTPSANAIIMPLAADDIRPWRTYEVHVAYAFPGGLRSRIVRELAIRRDPPVVPENRPNILATPHGRYLLIPKQPESDGAIRAIHFRPVAPEAPSAQL